tara:strand:- start:144 stop:278 length:135 start_codon:yes stop_codon:yes gene_type:complete
LKEGKRKEESNKEESENKLLFEMLLLLHKGLFVSFALNIGLELF